MFKCLNVSMTRGVSLYLTIIVMSILLAVVLGLTAILINQMKMIRGMENSVIAFYAADTGIEWILQYRANPKTVSEDGGRPDNTCIESNPCQLQQESEAKYYVEVETGIDCGANNYCIKSVGTYKETARAIEVSY